jgi:hypothetical protein
LIGGKYVITSIGERLHLVTPRMSRLGETVTQDDTRTTGVAGLGDNKIDTVSENGALLNAVAHGLSLAD